MLTRGEKETLKSRQLISDNGKKGHYEEFQNLYSVMAMNAIEVLKPYVGQDALEPEAAELMMSHLKNEEEFRKAVRNKCAIQETLETSEVFATMTELFAKFSIRQEYKKLEH